MSRRPLIVLPPWIALAPAFALGWLPWWYAFPLAVAFSMAERGAEEFGRAAGEGDT